VVLWLAAVLAEEAGGRGHRGDENERIHEVKPFRVQVDACSSDDAEARSFRPKNQLLATSPIPVGGSRLVNSLCPSESQSGRSTSANLSRGSPAKLG
jgi:hypothetical protein